MAAASGGLVKSSLARKTIEVLFLPEGERLRLPASATVIEAARSAGVDLISPCGGDGLCGKCRVVVRKGEVRAARTTLLSREEIREGYVLACQTRIDGDVEIEVPPESRSEGSQFLIDLDAQRFRALHPVAEAVSFRFAPLVQKIWLRLPPPTLQDSLSDQSRLFREVQRRQPAEVMQMGLKVAQRLPGLLRESNWDVTCLLGWRGGTLELVQLEPGNTAEQNYGVAVDIGTSTVVVHLLDLTTTRQVDAEAVYNSQRAFGEEVTRRLIFAESGGLETLQRAIVNDINGLISALSERNNVSLHDITAVVCTGNTTMAHLLLGIPPGTIRKSPYVPASAAPPPVRAVEVGIHVNPRGLLYVAPNIGGWVGGDITGGILAVGLHKSERVRMLIDIGTNGEIAIGSRDWLIACAASAGPAFEGSGVRCGMKARRGAIERVSLTPEGNVQYRTVGNTRPHGICGSGLIDLVAELYTAGFVDRSGRLLPDRCTRIRERDGILEFLLVPAARTETNKDIVISQSDLTNLLSAKAAIYAGARALASSVGLNFEDIETVLIAGAFGSYIDRRKAITIGLIPDLPLDRIRFVGNTSILGAEMALLSVDAWRELNEIAHSVTYYDLISHPDYYDEFLAAKFIPHTELERFQSVPAGMAEERV
jgi:uncharacterized 2Fe-2S/4Fe-4S cluster protein (DUF4445 family)